MVAFSNLPFPRLKRTSTICKDKALDSYSSYERIVLIADFNSEDHETFLYQHDLENIVKEGTCFKNSFKPFTTDLFLTNNSSYFQNIKSSFTGQIFINW